MKRAIVPAALAWIIGVCAMLFAALQAAVLDAHQRGDAFSLGSSISSSLLALLLYLLIYTIGVAVVVFPTCLFVVVPLLRFLPRSSPLWRPSCAAALGATVGPLAMYVWSVGLRLQFYIPDAHDSNQIWGAVAAALVGATFGYLYAKSAHIVRA